MSDLIRREDAIKAMSEALVRVFPANQQIAEKCINALPSAESEQKLDEWCIDCKEYDQEKYCCHRWNRVIRTTVEEMKQQKHGKWILVSQGVHGGYFECSECGNRALYAEDGVEELSKHCPHCGAKMEGEHE